MTVINILIIRRALDKNHAFSLAIKKPHKINSFFLKILILYSHALACISVSRTTAVENRFLAAHRPKMN
ncbi:hypothetical protein CDC45_18230 (plasmid) [Ralstonia pseudosolanacearum]|uniref:Uncharacterized protein n=1 Tax=Ralstonia nicotianae (strain ATCC BAA-1114 / GMI1000) TaxID=267608 RepID=Q8XTI1_RALN1|nr:hypothetical protein CDC45_18230 [Ralstonia pseudosolanacearum]CAD17280.1 hypothetical protein RSp0129 [Ralstonia pseudosolanacearum GMI1000]